MKMNTIGLVLSGGGARGFAHLGVLQYLMELGIKPAIISGTSAGSLAGAFYAAGYSPEETLQFGKTEKFLNYSAMNLKNGGLFSPDIFEKIIKKYISHDQMELLQIPLYVATTDLTNARLSIFNSGSLSLAVKSSCCVPLVFQPVLHEGAYLSDGGILNNFPVEALIGRCDKIIGVNVSSIDKAEGKMSYRTIATRTIQMTLANTAISQKVACNVYIEPPNLLNYGIFDFKKIEDIYQLGYESARKYKNELLGLKTD